MGRATGAPAHGARLTLNPPPPAPRRTARPPAAAEDPRPLDVVGRDGELRLRYERQGAQTVLAFARCRSPWHVLPPMALDEPEWAYSLLVNPSGGLVGGDRLSVKITAGPHSRVLLSSPSATRVYRSAREPVRQRVELTVRRDAVVEWVPEVTIPYAGARFDQRIHATVEPGATLLLWNAFASGRIARNERWAFDQLDDEVRISMPSAGTVLERLCLRRGAPGWENALAREWDYVGTCYVVHDALHGSRGVALRHRLREVLDRGSRGALAGVSEPPVPGAVAKVVARSARDLGGAFDALWETIRDQLWGLPVARLRRY